MSYASEQSEYYEAKQGTTEPRRDTINDAAEQLYKEIAVIQELANKLRERLNLVMVPGTPRDESAKLAAVNSSSPFVGQLFDMRGGVENVSTMLRDIDRRLTL